MTFPHIDDDVEDSEEADQEMIGDNEAANHIPETLDFSRKYVIIDVGGERFQADRNSFLRYPNTRLGKLMSCSVVADILQHCEEFIPGDPPEYFFDKNPENFASVLEMYRSGKFHIPDGGRGKNFKCLVCAVNR